MLDVILRCVLPIYLAIGLGYAISLRLKMDLDPLNSLVLNLFGPCLIYSSLAGKPFDLPELALVSGVMGAMVVVQVLVYLWVIGLLKRPELRGGSLSIAFANTGAINLPLCYLAFGEDGLRVAVLVLVVVALLHYSIGIWAVAGNRAGWELIKSPLLYAAVAGLLVGYSRYEPPAALSVTVDMLGQAAIPLLLIMLGFQLSATPLTCFGQGALVAIGRSLGGVAIVWPLVLLLDIQGTTAAVLVVSASMPPAITNFMLARRYDGNPELNAGAIVVGTLLAMALSTILLVIFKA